MGYVRNKRRKQHVQRFMQYGTMFTALWYCIPTAFHACDASTAFDASTLRRPSTPFDASTLRQARLHVSLGSPPEYPVCVHGTAKLGGRSREWLLPATDKCSRGGHVQSVSSVQFSSVIDRNSGCIPPETYWGLDTIND